MTKRSPSSGFTLTELMIAIAIIIVLAGIVLAILGTGRDRANTTKIESQMKSMVSQADLYTGAPTPVAATTADPVATAGGTLFNDSTISDNSLYRLVHTLPSGTVVYYASNGVLPVGGGYWALAASTANGSLCVDYTGVIRTQTASTMTAATAATIYPNLATLYTCN